MMNRDDEDGGVCLSTENVSDNVSSSIDDDIPNNAETLDTINGNNDQSTSNTILEHTEPVVYSTRAENTKTTFKKIFTSEQTLSQAKGLLYPDENTTMSSTCRDQYANNPNTLSKRDLLGSSAFEGNSAKEALYPVNPPSQTVNINVQNVEGAEPKSLLYPEDQLIDITSVKPHPCIHAQEGDGTRDFLDPKEHSSSDLVYSSSRGSENNEGEETKVLLYPDECLVDITPFKPKRSATSR